MKQLIIFAWSAVLLSSAAVAADTAPAKEPRQARIPFANSGSIDNWQADGRQALYIQGPGRQWYHARLAGYCPDLDFATAIGFETRGIGDFDSFSTIIVRGHRCPLTSLVKSGPPPSKIKKPKKD
ncbi:DUF6491 family protein [Sphingomonas sp. SRS2]|uniref:DUF6491 family protein n=1 Tax=Sphingomonas sp. SRS2 TaxID=133190 RepID=UPI0006184830|nr:DUF6491 family protein [Sphingomonas sp. SRS2]KKC26312.1 hypothetical protein WP12_09615 [Sphingomonas sp. SRS2]